jgi:UDP-GlcNAc:undecaprenyl-phosphate GlcNAc-1-phosphate transferase
MMVVFVLSLAGISFLISLAATFAMVRLAPQVGFVDKPGHRKIHQAPIPLGGGVAIFLAFALPLAIGVIVCNWVKLPEGSFRAALAGGVVRQTPMALALLAAMLILHAMGLRDDRKALGPYIKLAVQIAVTLALVAPFRPLWLLTAVDDRLHAGGIFSITLSVLWIVAITNAFNFLDNMDGLSAGVAAVCAAAFLITTILIQQWFVAATLALLLGALLGFLCFNFPPAKIFMGDSGSLLLGLVLGVLTIRTTYLLPGQSLGAGWYSVFTPVIVLAVPLYDLIVVSLIRIARGKSPFVGDTNHFSHRLVARGMSKRTAVLCLYLVSAATAVAAIVLPHVGSSFAAALIFVQTVLILCVVALLEQHPLPSREAQPRAVETGTPPGGGNGAPVVDAKAR